ncbi:MAG: DMT family transporter [Vallitalea sp.]|jgi:transporter family-2 protein|nr:DMT family transporter [Vallitalea sp.]
MCKIIAIFNGVLITFMIAVNGFLAGEIGNNASLICIHLIGLITLCIIFLIRKEKFKSIKGLSIYLFTGGAIGVFIVFFNNICFNNLGASLTLGLGLLGQLIASMLIDNFGLLGVKKNKINIRKLTGIGIMTIGIIIMIVL